MPITLISEIAPKNSGQFALVDDAYIRGGFHIVDNLTTRNTIPTDRRKYGMKVFVQSTDLVYELQSDLISWQIDRGLTTTLQESYNNGAEIVTTANTPVVITGQDITSRIFTIRNLSDDILKVSADKRVEFTDTLIGKDYTTSITATINTNSTNVVIDITNRDQYRAVQYFYTIQNSDNTGYETGQLYLIHNGSNATLYSLIGNQIDTPCNVLFDCQIIGADLSLLATTDNSIAASRIIHLFKVVLL